MKNDNDNMPREALAHEAAMRSLGPKVALLTAVALFVLAAGIYTSWRTTYGVTLADINWERIMHD